MNLKGAQLSLCPSWTLVACLFDGRSPTAVLRAVGAVIVDTIQAPIRWPLSHVSNKRRKGVQPFIAHADAAPTIVGISRQGRITATLFSSSPTAISGIRTPVWRMAVDGIDHTARFLLKAPARGCISSPQIAQSSGRGLSALTQASDSSIVPFIWSRIAGYGEASIFVSQNVKPSHAVDYMGGAYWHH